MITAKTPWKDYMGDVPMHLDYFEGSMFEAVEAIAAKYPRNIAFDFMGKSTTYAELIGQIEICAKSLKAMGMPEVDWFLEHFGGSFGLTLDELRRQ